MRPDARGCGCSSTPRVSFRHRDDVAALIDRLDAGSAALVGLSMGARIAIDTALEHPDLVHRVLISGAGAGEPVFQAPWVLDILAEQQAAQAALDPQRWIQAFVRFAAGPSRDLMPSTARCSTISPR